MIVLDPRRRSGAWTPVCVLLVALTAAPALGDGVHVKKWLTLEQAIKRSTAVLVVRVIRTDSRYGSASPRGESYRYMQVFRALTRVKSVVRGDRRLVARRSREVADVLVRAGV